MLQLPPSFGPGLLPRLAGFLDALPRGFRYAVELRHEVFFRGGDEEDDAMTLLRDRGIDLVRMDARGLHASIRLAHTEVRHRKPDLPVVMRATASQPIVRLGPHEDLAAGRHFVEPWIPQLATWIAQGKRPCMLVHAPDDTFAAENAYSVHAMLRAVVDVGDLPPWPGGPRQLGLFQGVGSSPGLLS